MLLESATNCSVDSNNILYSKLQPDHFLIGHQVGSSLKFISVMSPKLIVFCVCFEYFLLGSEPPSPFHGFEIFSSEPP